MGRSGVGGSGDSNCRRFPGSRERTDYSQVGECHNLPEFLADANPHHFGKSDPDPHQRDKLDPDTHQRQMRVPNPHQSQNSGAVGGGSKWNNAGP